MKRSFQPAVIVALAITSFAAWACQADSKGHSPDDDAGADASSDADSDTDGDVDTDNPVDPACDTACEGGEWSVYKELVFTVDAEDGGTEPTCAFSLGDVDWEGFPCDWLDPSYVTVSVDHIEIPYSETQSSISHWWIYATMTIDGPPPELQICGEACDRIQNGEVSEVTMALWSCAL